MHLIYYEFHLLGAVAPSMILVETKTDFNKNPHAGLT